MQEVEIGDEPEQGASGRASPVENSPATPRKFGMAGMGHAMKAAVGMTNQARIKSQMGKADKEVDMSALSNAIEGYAAKCL